MAAFDRDRDLGVQRRKRVAELEQATAKIRAMPGFGGFMRAPSVGDLRQAAAPGPLVFLNVSRYRSDALIVTADGIRPPVRLDKVSPSIVAGQVADLISAVEAAANADTFRPAQEALAQVLEWLWETTAAPVLSELGYARKPAAERPHLWWAPTGLLSYLPVHAAAQDGSGALDRVISSYTPTAYALVESRKRPAPPGESQTMLVIAMPQTPGRPDLKGAAKEANMLAARFPGLEVLPGPGRKPPRMPAWTQCSPHCLGMRSRISPATVNATWPYRPQLLADLRPRARPPDHRGHRGAEPGSRPARLSLGLPDRAATLGLTNEAQHLVTAFGLAGYSHVIGTLWKVSDSAAFSLAKRVYATLAPPGVWPLQAGLAADALHAAVHEGLRDWTPTIRLSGRPTSTSGRHAARFRGDPGARTQPVGGRIGNSRRSDCLAGSGPPRHSDVSRRPHPNLRKPPRMPLAMRCPHECTARAMARQRPQPATTRQPRRLSRRYRATRAIDDRSETQ